MKSLELTKTYKEWLQNNPSMGSEERLIARALLATESEGETLFITGASFEKVAEVYQSLISGTKQHAAEEVPSDKETSLQTNERKKRINRSSAIEHVVSMLKQNNPQFVVKTSKYGTLHAEVDEQPIKIKVIISKNYLSADTQDNPNFKGKFCCSWHKELDKHIPEYDYHVYVVENGDSYKALLFTTDEINQHLAKKSYNDDFVNYYFHWHNNGKVTDEREANLIDVTSFDADFTNWSLK